MNNTSSFELISWDIVHSDHMSDVAEKLVFRGHIVALFAFSVAAAVLGILAALT